MPAAARILAGNHGAGRSFKACAHRPEGASRLAEQGFINRRNPTFKPGGRVFRQRSLVTPAVTKCVDHDYTSIGTSRHVTEAKSAQRVYSGFDVLVHGRNTSS